MAAPTHTLVTLGSNPGLKKLAFFLSRASIVVHAVDSLDAAATVCQEVGGDAIVVCWPTPSCTEEEVAALAGRVGPEERPVLVLLAEPDTVADVGRLTREGVVILPADRSALRLEQSLAGLFAAGARRSVRMLVRLKVEIDDSHVHRACQTVNLSESGMALRTGEAMAPGDRVAFAFFLPDDDKRIEGEAEVVRRVDPAAEGFEGLGVRFLDFRADGRDRLEEFLGTSQADRSAASG